MSEIHAPARARFLHYFLFVALLDLSSSLLPPCSLSNSQDIISRDQLRGWDPDQVKDENSQLRERWKNIHFLNSPYPLLWDQELHLLSRNLTDFDCGIHSFIHWLKITALILSVSNILFLLYTFSTNLEHRQINKIDNAKKALSNLINLGGGVSHMYVLVTNWYESCVLIKELKQICIFQEIKWRLPLLN